MRSIFSKKILLSLVIATFVLNLSACSTPEEKAQKFYEKGMTLLESDPNKAKLEFQNALQMKNDMTSALYGLALVAEKQSDWKACFGLLKKVLENEPKHVNAMVKIGQIYLAAGEISKAKEQADQAVSLEPENLDAIMLQAAMDLKAGQVDAAVEKANFVLSKNQKNTDAYMVLASARQSQNDKQGAIALLNKALQVDNKNRAVHLFKISLSNDIGDKALTESAWKDTIEAFPEDYPLRGKFAEYLYKNNKNDAAESQLRYVVEHQTNVLQPKLTLIQFLLQTKGPDVARTEMEKMLKQNPDDFELSFYLVDFYESQGDTAAAEVQLKSIMNYAGNKPEGLKAKTKVATRFLAQNKKTEAVKLINDVLAVDARNNDALLLKSGISIDEKKYDEAISDLRAVLGDQPNSAQALFLLGKAYDEKGSSALAEESYVKALEASKYSPQYAVAYSRSLINRQDYKRAEKVLEDVLNRNPNNIAITRLLAQVKLSKGDIEGAQKIAESVKGATNSNLYDLIDGAVLLRKDDYHGAIAAFERAHQKTPSDMQPILAITKAHLSKKAFTDAKTFLEQLLMTQPKNYDIKLLLAQVYEMSGDKQKSIETLDSAIALEPKISRAYQQLAALHLRNKDTVAASSAIEKGLSALPESFDLNMALAEIHQNNQDYSSAVSIYKKLLNINPNAIVVLNNYISVVSDYESDKSKLEQAYQDAKPLKDSAVPQFLDTYGWISFRVGKNEEAIKQLSLAIEKAPEYAVFHYHLGKVYLAEQNKTEAKKSFEKALKFAKSNNQDYVNEIKELLKTI
jgi:cellulose synthase operon protein C